MKSTIHPLACLLARSMPAAGSGGEPERLFYTLQLRTQGCKVNEKAMVFVQGEICTTSKSSAWVRDPFYITYIVGPLKLLILLINASLVIVLRTLLQNQHAFVNLLVVLAVDAIH
jgi:hypothetical protein